MYKLCSNKTNNKKWIYVLTSNSLPAYFEHFYIENKGNIKEVVSVSKYRQNTKIFKNRPWKVKKVFEEDLLWKFWENAQEISLTELII